jgi:regulator of RNase E activity RraA
MGIQLFAGSVAVSHAYAHIFEIGTVVHVGGMEVRPGDLLHGDRHGVLTVPAELAASVPAVADRLQQAEQRIIDFCRSKDFSVQKLREVMKTLS